MTDTPTAIHAWLHRRDQNAARWIVDTHRPVVLRSIRGWLPDRDMEEDVVQEVFIKAFKALPNLTVNHRLDAWLSCIARNTCANVLRRWKRRMVLTATECGMEDFDHYAAPEEEPSVTLQARREAQLHHLLALLNEQDRRMLWLYHAEGLKAEAVGHQMGLSAGNVRVRVLRSQRALRASVSRD